MTVHICSEASNWECVAGAPREIKQEAQPDLHNPMPLLPLFECQPFFTIRIARQCLYFLCDFGSLSDGRLFLQRDPLLWMELQ
jgi:hypothetical protein